MATQLLFFNLLMTSQLADINLAIPATPVFVLF